MWVLSSAGDFLQGKRMWLKPGQRYLFGRIRKDGVRFAIDHKTVSRKHFVLEVADVPDNEIGNIHFRTKVTIKDEKSKAGTSVDGELIKDETRTLQNAVNSVRPGSSPDELVIRWEPKVLTYSLTKKEIKQGVLKSKQEKAKGLDVRITSEYITNQTTHVVAGKRNTAKGLQALVEGAAIVAESWIDALILAATQTDLSEEENLCPLELDFEEGWPDEDQHLPAPGNEPSRRPADMYRSDENRHTVFEKWSLIFFDKGQYENLMPVVTAGHGKALLYPVKENETAVDDVLSWIHEHVNGDKKRLLIVKTTEKTEEDMPWLDSLIVEAGVRLGIIPTLQADFLDAILVTDPGQLRKEAVRISSVPSGQTIAGHNLSSTKIRDAIAGVENGTSSTQRQNGRVVAHDADRAESAVSESAASSSIPAASEEEINPRPVKRARFHRPIVRKKKNLLDGFDDGFDPESLQEYEEDDESAPESIHAVDRHKSKGRAHSIHSSNESQTAHGGPSDESDFESGPRTVVRTNGKSISQAISRNGAHNSEEDDGDTAFLDDFLPASTALAKKKLAGNDITSQQVHGAQSPKLKNELLIQTRNKPDAEPLDVKQTLKAERVAEAEARRKEREKETEEHDSALVEELGYGPANLVKIVTFDLPVRPGSKDSQDSTDVSTARKHNGYRGVEWLEEWNGRPNFKGFRRARSVNGETNAHANGSQHRNPRDKIIVPVVAVKQPTYGLGEKYWERSQEDREADKRRKARKKAKENQLARESQRHDRSQTLEHEDDEFEGDVELSNDNRNHEADWLRTGTEEALGEEIEVDSPRRTRADGSQPSTTAARQKGKRTASATSLGRGMTKKAKASSDPTKQTQLPVTTIRGSDSDGSNDSDDLKFRFGSRAKG